MKTVAVVPVHNALAYAERCLEQIRVTVPALCLVVVDDASDQETRERLEKIVQATNQDDNTAVMLTNARQQLFTRAANRGIRYAYHHGKAEAIAVVNSDCDLYPRWLEYLQMGLDDPQVGVVGYPNAPEPGDAWREMLYRDVEKPDYVTGHCLLLRVAMLGQIGIFCETDTTGRDSPELAPYLGQAHIGSDRILSWRANAAGWKTRYCNYPGVTHEGGKSWGHRLHWLRHFCLAPLWKPSDTLEEPELETE